MATLRPSGKYRSQVYLGKDENGKRKYQYFEADTAEEADYLADGFRLGKLHPVKTQNLTIGEAMDKYIESKTNILSPATIRGYKKIKKNHLLQITNVVLKEITPELIQKEINREAKTHSPKTVRNVHGLLSSALNMYYPEFRLYTTLPQKQKKEMNIPTDEELTKILKQAEETNHYIPIMCGAFLGMRRSEICALRWSDIDFKNKTLKIRGAKVQDDSDEWVIKETTKTYSSTRTIEISDIMVDAFKKYKNDSEYIITIQPGQITIYFQEILKQCGINKKIRFHDLRHYNASIMHKLNVPDKYAQRRGGWTTDYTYKNVYTHTFDEEFQRTEKAINNYFDSMMQPEVQPDKEITPDIQG